jgi:aminobenzoyl-glutamate utilization protein B
MKRLFSAVLFAALCMTVAAKPAKRDLRHVGMDYLDKSFAVYDSIQKRIHGFAEPGFREYRSSATLADFLEENGFSVERGVAEIPTAFIATFGSGSPVIGVMAEYDALPGLSQDTVSFRKPVGGMDYGHGCGHNLIGTASVAAGVSISRFLAASGLPGTIKVFGCPAEENGSGKAYMVMAGCFNGCDAVFDWHPSGGNRMQTTPGLAIISARFTFKGVSAHASGAPWKGRSALDGVEAFDYMMNMMREHIPPSARVHYVITDGGKAPNVVPDQAQVLYYFRHPSGAEARKIFDRAVLAAEGAAMGTGTSMEYEIMGGNYEILINRSLAQIIQDNLVRVGGLDLDSREREFIKDLAANSGSKDPEKDLERMSTVVEKLGPPSSGGGSTDVGNVSQIVPVATLQVATTVSSAGMHTWQQTASGGTTIGTKALLNVARIYYLSAVDIYTDPARLGPVKEEFRSKRGEHPGFVPLMGNRKPPLDYRD